MAGPSAFSKFHVGRSRRTTVTRATPAPSPQHTHTAYAETPSYLAHWQSVHHEQCTAAHRPSRAIADIDLLARILPRCSPTTCARLHCRTPSHPSSIIPRTLGSPSGSFGAYRPAPAPTGRSLLESNDVNVGAVWRPVDLPCPATTFFDVLPVLHSDVCLKYSLSFCALPLFHFFARAQS